MDLKYKFMFNKDRKKTKMRNDSDNVAYITPRLQTDALFQMRSRSSQKCTTSAIFIAPLTVLKHGAFTE